MSSESCCSEQIIRLADLVGHGGPDSRAVVGCPPTPAHRTVSSQEECVRSDHRKTHPSPNKVSHLTVLPFPLDSKHTCDPPFGSPSMLLCHTIDRVKHGGKVPSPFETSLLILYFLSSCSRLKYLLRFAIPVTLGVSSVSQT